MVKLIIWDLDDTLWHGTLAEAESVTLITERAEAIRTLNAQGVVNSICSKNDHANALRKLEEFGMRDEFVFPDISFQPKGARIRRIVEDMNLRFPDVVFADDNDINLREAEFECTGIQTINAGSTDFDSFLQSLIQETSGGRSRVERYRILEQKKRDQEDVGGSNEDFLKSTNIRVCFVRMADNLPFAGRIQELINRTNQLNFLKTRVKPGEVEEMLISPNSYEVSVFVWDNYGNYGLVGFGAITKEGPSHFTFSCRTMNMGIEQATAWALRSFRASRGMKLPVDPTVLPWITVVSPDDPEAIEKIAESADEGTAEAKARIMANCQSAAIAHYMDVPFSVDFDNWPRTFTLADYMQNHNIHGAWRPVMVYAAFVDYLADYWPNGTLPSLKDYEEASRAFALEAESNGSKLLVLLPVEDFLSTDSCRGISPEEFAAKNAVWNRIATESSSVEVIELSAISNAAGAIDPRHFTRDQLVELASIVSQKTITATKQ